MDFAKNLLFKYGWKEGEGIGKNSDGIAKPIKAVLKFDSAGLGHDRAEEFNNHWWENAFNSAAKNIDIKQSSENVSMTLKNGESIEITTKSYSIQNLKKEKGSDNSYGGLFLKSRSSLHKDESSDDEKNKIQFNSDKLAFKAITDDDLLKACGGRTAHKGARHGLSLSGKLSRIEEQERQLLEKYSNNFNRDTAQDVFKDWVKVDSLNKKKRKMKAPEITDVISPDSEKLATLLNQNDYVVKYKSKKKKKRQKAMYEDLALSLSNLNTHNPESPQKSKCDRKLHVIQDVCTAIKKKEKALRKRKRRRNRSETETGLIDGDIELIENNATESSEVEKYLKKSKAKKIIEKAIAIKSLVVEKTSKKRKRKDDTPLLDLSDNSFSSDCDEKFKESRLAKQIKLEMDKQPKKKFKVVVENITPFQSKHLLRAGINFVEKKQSDPKKIRQEHFEFENIATKLAASMSFDETDNGPIKKKKKKKKSK